MSPSMIEGDRWHEGLRGQDQKICSVSHWGRSFLWIMPSVTVRARVAAIFCDDLSPYETAQIWVGRTRSLHWIMKVPFWVPREDLAAKGAGSTYTMYASRSPINVLISNLSVAAMLVLPRLRLSLTWNLEIRMTSKMRGKILRKNNETGSIRCQLHHRQLLRIVMWPYILCTNEKDAATIPRCVCSVIPEVVRITILYIPTFNSASNTIDHKYYYKSTTYLVHQTWQL